MSSFFFGTAPMTEIDYFYIPDKITKNHAFFFFCHFIKRWWWGSSIGWVGCIRQFFVSLTFITGQGLLSSLLFFFYISKKKDIHLRFFKKIIRLKYKGLLNHFSPIIYIYIYKSFLLFLIWTNSILIIYVYKTFCFFFLS